MTEKKFSFYYSFFQKSTNFVLVWKTIVLTRRTISPSRNSGSTIVWMNSRDECILVKKAIALGRSGCRIIAERYGVNIKTVRQGKKEFLNPDFDAPVHIRKKGGGAKKN